MDNMSEKIAEFFSRRATVRKYKDDAPSRELIDSLLAAAMRAPTTGNMQLYSVVETRDPEMRRRLAELHFNQPAATGAPLMLTFCADYHRTSAWCRQRKAEPGYDNFLSFINAATDALLFCQSFCTLAEAAGLGLCYLGTTIYRPEDIIDALGLPELVMPVATITLGYPAEEPALSDRLPLTAFVHDEAYRRPTPESIDRDYAAREALPENREFVRINAKETLAQVFTDLRYTRRDCEAMSEGLLRALRRQRFME